MKQLVSAVATWLVSQGGYISPSIAPCWTKQYGNGLCATAMLHAPVRVSDQLEPGSHHLIKIPPKLALTAQGRADNIEQQRHALSMRLLEEKAKGEASPWSDYIEALPPVPQAKYATEHNQCQVTAARSGIDLALHRRIARLQSEYVEKVCPAHPKFCESISFEDYSWAAHIVQTRAFTISGKWRALFPFGDYVNHHGSRPNVHWLIDENNDFVLVQMHASEDIHPGEQLLMSYGNGMSPETLLMQYGFFEGHLSCVDVVLDGELFCLSPDVRMKKIGKALEWLSRKSNGDPESVLTLLIEALVKQESRLDPSDSGSACFDRFSPDRNEIMRYHAEQKKILSHLRLVVSTALLSRSHNSPAKEPRAPYNVGSVLYHITDRLSIVRIKQVKKQSPQKYTLERLFSWPNIHDDRIETAVVETLDNVPSVLLIEQAPYLLKLATAICTSSSNAD